MFKKYIEREDKDEFLNNFEKAVVFIASRKDEQNNQENVSDKNSKLLACDELIKSVNEDIKKMKSADKHLKSQLDILEEKLNKIDMPKNDSLAKTKNKSKKKFCTIS